jgi:hypothetical protein
VKPNLYRKKLDKLAQTCHSSDNVKVEDFHLGQPMWKVRPHLQNNHSKRAGGKAQGVECLPSKCGALTASPVPYKRICFAGFVTQNIQFSTKNCDAPKQ